MLRRPDRDLILLLVPPSPIMPLNGGLVSLMKVCALIGDKKSSAIILGCYIHFLLFQTNMASSTPPNPQQFALYARIQIIPFISSVSNPLPACVGCDTRAKLIGDCYSLMVDGQFKQERWWCNLCTGESSCVIQTHCR